MIKRQLLELLDRRGGVLQLRPELVRRFYPDFNRLNQNKIRKNNRQFIPERWIGSSVEAINPPPMPGGGLSMLSDAELSLRDAIRLAPEEMVGPRILAAHGAEFRVLVKLLDPGEPIVFHIHASDRQVAAMPRHFKGHRFGKDEAYYFLDAPKGPQPYTHGGLYEGVGRKELVAAIKRGREHALELSPVFYQEYGTGFFMPAAIPHRPGTGLTLEIQQPSDVYTLLETHSAGKPMPAEQIHPGFKSLDEALGLIDYKTATKVGKMDGYRLMPQAIGRKNGSESAWVFPSAVCRKFAGKRHRVVSRMTMREDLPFVLWAWKGRGTLNGRPLKAGAEYFVTDSAARAGIELTNTGEELLELFTFFPGGV